jgi:transcriptional regulator with XRE-family HTH domain
LVTTAQLRAARGLLDWTVRDLAARAGVHRNTIARAETEFADHGHAVAQIVRAIEAAGVEFLNGDRPGVRLRAWSIGDLVRLRPGCEKYAEAIGVEENEIMAVRDWTRSPGDPPPGRVLLARVSGAVIESWVPTTLLERSGRTPHSPFDASEKTPQ